MIFLNPGESQIVKFELTERDVSIFDASIEDWKRASGKFTAHIGTSSRKLVWSNDFTLLAHVSFDFKKIRSDFLLFLSLQESEYYFNDVLDFCSLNLMYVTRRDPELH